MTIQLCKDCRWAALEEAESGMVWRCTHTRSKFVPSPDYVTGKPVKARQLSCYEARNSTPVLVRLSPDGIQMNGLKAVFAAFER